MKKNWELTGFCVLGLALSVAIRLALLPGYSGDMTDFLAWYDYIVSHGGFLALQDGFSNYSPAYNFMLVLATFLPVGKIAAIKVIPFVFEYLAAGFAFRIVRLKYPRGALAPAAAFLVLFSPTVLLNGAYWGQCDMIHSACLLAALYYFALHRPKAGMIWVGVALSFKLQAAFISPFLLFLILKRELRIRYLLIPPGVYLLTAIPTLLAGRPWGEVLGIYFTQFGYFQALTANAPTLYNWLPAQPEAIFGQAGLVLAAFVALAFSFGTYRRGLKTDPSGVLQVGLGAYVLLVFFLPRMHERYFFAADLISLVYLFYFPRLFMVPVLINLGSLLSYAPFLFGMTVVPLTYVAFLPIAAAILIVREIIRGSGSPGHFQLGQAK